MTNLVEIRETLSLPEADVVSKMRAGFSIMHNLTFDFGVKVVADNDGRALIVVNEDPIGSGSFAEGVIEVVLQFGSDDNPKDGALREFMERIAVKWLEKVAPHRLAAS